MKKIILVLLWLSCVGAGMSQAPQKVGVYVTGEVNAGNKKIAGQKIVSGISSNPDFVATERTVSFLSELAKDHDYKVNAPVNETRIIEIGRQFGLDYVVVAELTEAMGELVISSQMMDVQGNSQAVSAENIVKVRQASDLMRAAEDVAKQLLDNLHKQKEATVQPEMQENAVADLYTAKLLFDNLNKLKATAIQQEMQENAVAMGKDVRQDSAVALSPKFSLQRISIELVDKVGLLGNGVKMMLQSFMEEYITKLQGYEVYDSSIPTGYGSGDRKVDGLLVVEVNGLTDNKIVYTAKLLDLTGRVIWSVNLIGDNEMDAYQRDCEKVLDELFVKNR